MNETREQVKKEMEKLAKKYAQGNENIYSFCRRVRELEQELYIIEKELDLRQ